jgi:hypothetical protein
MDLLNDHDLTRLADQRGMPIEGAADRPDSRGGQTRLGDEG